MYLAVTRENGHLCDKLGFNIAREALTATDSGQRNVGLKKLRYSLTGIRSAFYHTVFKESSVISRFHTLPEG